MFSKSFSRYTVFTATSILSLVSSTYMKQVNALNPNTFFFKVNVYKLYTTAVGTSNDVCWAARRVGEEKTQQTSVFVDI